MVSNCAIDITWYTSLGIALRDLVHRGLRELRLDVEHRLRVRLRVGGAFAVQLEESRGISDEGIADLPHARVGRQVIVALTDAQPALAGVREQSIRVLQIRADAHAERREAVRRLELGQRGGQVRCRRNLRDAGHRRVDRLRSERVDRQGVHARFVVRADLEDIRRRPCRSGVNGFHRRLDDVAHDELVLVLHLVERTPRRVRRRNRAAFEPASVRERVEIAARRAGRVEVGSIERRSRRSAAPATRPGCWAEIPAAMHNAKCNRRKADREVAHENEGVRVERLRPVDRSGLATDQCANGMRKLFA